MAMRPRCCALSSSQSLPPFRLPSGCHPGGLIFWKSSESQRQSVISPRPRARPHSSIYFGRMPTFREPIPIESLRPSRVQ
jgi:hypothetical protein